MKYLCLVYLDERKWDAMSAADYDALVGEILAYRDDLRQSGHLVVADALHHGEPATTIRLRGGKVAVTGGPFADNKEQLGGFYLIDATALNDAIRLAARIPSARFGSVEIRPIKELDHR